MGHYISPLEDFKHKVPEEYEVPQIFLENLLYGWALQRGLNPAWESTLYDAVHRQFS